MGETNQEINASIDPEFIYNALRGVIDPELGLDIVDLGMVRKVTVGNSNHILVEIALTIVGCPLRAQIERDVSRAISRIPGVQGVEIQVGFMSQEERSDLMAKARLRKSENPPVTEVSENTRVIAIASGKGGVGKSSVTVNLAVALAKKGLTVGLLDADIWGFTVPRMIGVEGELSVNEHRKILPMEKPVGSGLVKVISMGFLAQEDSAIMWRGLMLNKAVEQFLRDVAWGELDYLVIDMPPGTGDVQMGLARMLPRTEVIIVTTPPVAAQKVASRAGAMARKGYLRIAGIIENMSGFMCEHGTFYSIFGQGGGQRLSQELGVPLIGSIPIDATIASRGDIGVPVALDNDSSISKVFDSIASAITLEISPLIEMTGCSARLLESVRVALDN